MSSPVRSQFALVVACHRRVNCHTDESRLCSPSAQGGVGRHTLEVPTAPGDEYELVVQSIVGHLAKRAGVETTRLEHDVDVIGRATTNQIDVLWDFTDAVGKPHRVVFEARDHKNPIKQGSLHAFRSVVDDVQSGDRPVEGIMVTTTGYQRGAKRIAETYGLLVLELRLPTTADLANRLEAVVITINPVIPVVTELAIEVVEMLDAEAWADRDPWAPLELQQRGSDQDPLSLQRVLTDGELGSLEAPRALHRVQRVFEPPAILILDHQPVATLHSASATVGSSAAPSVTVTVGGLKSVAWMLRDALSGARIWFGERGEVWSTDS